MDYTAIDFPRRKNTKVLALGAHSKGSVCFIRKDVAYLSRPLGDLSDLKTFRLFENEVRNLKKKLKILPEIIACDLHPEYISTKYANDLVKNTRLKLKPVQHHEAHVASCIADRKITGNVIGVAFDGTGFGLDGNIWGGEFFVGSIKGFKRVAHLQYIPMPGGEVAVREPYRMAVSYLYNAYGSNLPNLTRLDREKSKFLIQIIKKGINSPLTSSMGRFFDAVSSIIGICNVIEYDAQAAIELEKAISSSTSNTKSYNFDIMNNEDIFIIMPNKIIKGIVNDLNKKLPVGIISLKFHNTISDMIKNVSILLRKKYKISKVCLSGGVFQNKYLTSHTVPLLEKEGFEVYLHKNVPTDDSNIALGQAVLAG